jgi:hypothetical protein
MDNNVRNIETEIENVMRLYRAISNYDSTNRNDANNRMNNNNLNEERLIYMLYDVMMEYNNVVRTNTLNMRRYHDNIATFSQIIQRSHSNANRQNRQSGQYYYNRYPQNNNSVPNNNRSWRFSNPRSPTDSIYTNIIHETINHFIPNRFQDVIVRPTEEQINNATEIFNYVSGEYVHTNCPITLDEFRENESVCRINHCGHMFRETAIKNWFQQNVRCPVCRYDIRTENETEPGDDENEETTMDIVNNEAPQPSIPTPRNVPIDRFYTSISNGVQSILQNYLDRDFALDTSHNHVFSFEIPINIYNDLSGSSFT